MTSFSSVHICIAFRLLRRGNMKLHALLGILSLKTLWAGVKHWRTALHRFYVYRKPISSPRSCNLKVIQKCVHLKCICVWCLDNWSRILSGKPFNTFSMARLKTLQFRLTLTPLFTATHAFLISLSPFFFHDLWLG
jgi:hypothetical protein